MKRSLIVLMGLDGSGKTSQANLLADWLEQQGIRTQVVWMRGDSYLTAPLLKAAKWLLRAPKGRKRGEAETPETYRAYTGRKRSLMKSGFLRALWRMLVLADFYITFRLAFARLARGVRVVVLDRYVYDSLIDIVSGVGAGGSGVGGGGAGEVEPLLKSRFTAGFPRPDRIVLLDLEPAEAFRRKDDIPSLDYLTERNYLYRAVARATAAHTVDASMSIEAVQAAIRKALSDWVSDIAARRKTGRKTE